MSTATYTIDATHLTATASPVRTPKIRRALKAEWTKLRTLPRRGGRLSWPRSYRSP